MGVSFWWKTKHCPMTAMKIYHRFYKDTYELSWVFFQSRRKFIATLRPRGMAPGGSSPNYQPRLLKNDSPRSTYIDLDAPPSSISRYHDYYTFSGGIPKLACISCQAILSKVFLPKINVLSFIRISTHPNNIPLFLWPNSSLLFTRWREKWKMLDETSRQSCFLQPVSFGKVNIIPSPWVPVSWWHLPWLRKPRNQHGHRKGGWNPQEMKGISPEIMRSRWFCWFSAVLERRDGLTDKNLVKFQDAQGLSENTRTTSIATKQR